MIDDYRSLAVFNAVADAGSFSAAARHLRLSTSVVSHHVSKLEARLGVTLLFRSTRSLSLTPEGSLIRDAVRRMVQSGEEAIDLLADEADQPVGALRVAIPAFGGQGAVQEGIWAFARAYPMVALSLSSSDTQVDLFKDGFDLAIRVGNLADSSLKSRRIGEFRRVLVAAPHYLAAQGPVDTIDDLKACDFVGLSMVSDDITLERGGEAVSFAPENVRLEVDSVAAAEAAIRMGLGVQRLPLPGIARDLETGDLVELLPEWRLPELGVYAVWPDSGPQKRLTRLLIDFLADKRA